jgi:hypothetical protein
MGNNVFANGMEIACKAGDGKVPAAFPDVCLSPPSPPAGPIPVPYPVTSFAKDTTGGSKTVKISGKEVMLKNKSSYKKCIGDDAATKSLGMGVVTHCIQGKTYFVAWSFDIEVEGYNVDRHFDATNSNGMSTGNQVGWINFDSTTFDQLSVCDGVDEAYRLQPYRDQIGGTRSCPPPETGHHVIPGHLMKKSKSGRYTEGNGRCHHDTAPVICALGRSQWFGTHYWAHYSADGWEALHGKSGKKYPYDDALNNGAASCGMTVEGRELEPGDAAYECVRQQLDSYYEQCGINPGHEFTPARRGLNTDWAKGLPPVPRTPRRR